MSYLTIIALIYLVGSLLAAVHVYKHSSKRRLGVFLDHNVLIHLILAVGYVLAEHAHWASVA